MLWVVSLLIYPWSWTAFRDVSVFRIRSNCHNKVISLWLKGFACGEKQIVHHEVCCASCLKVSVIFYKKTQVKIVICWYVATCCWINRYQHFGVTYCLCTRLLEAAVSCTHTCYQTTFLEEYNLNIHHCENARYYMYRVNGSLTCSHVLLIHESKFIILILKV